MAFNAAMTFENPPVYLFAFDPLCLLPLGVATIIILIILLLLSTMHHLWVSMTLAVAVSARPLIIKRWTWDH